MVRNLELEGQQRICPECGGKCTVVPLLNDFDYSGTHCTHGRSGTHYPDDYGSPVSDCCDAYIDEEDMWWECKYCGENETPGCHKCVREDGQMVTDEIQNEAEWRQDTRGNR